MSIWTKIRDKVIRPVLGTAASVIPVVGPAIGQAILPKPKVSSGFVATPGVGAMSSLPALGGVVRAGGAVAAGVGVAAASGTRVARAAAALCRKHPAWCANIGGTAAIAALLADGTIPMPKRRRRRGITPGDLQSFRRVASLIKTHGPVARRVPNTCAPRKKCR